MKLSWKTTVAALVAAVGGAVLGAYQLKPELFVGWPAWVPGMALLLSSVGTAGVGVFARDNDKTSEDVGARVKGALLVLGVGVLAWGLTGCTTSRQVVERPVWDPTNRVVLKNRIELTERSVLKGTQSVDKIRGTITGTGASAGVAGQSQENSSGDVLVNGLANLVSLSAALKGVPVGGTAPVVATGGTGAAVVPVSAPGSLGKAWAAGGGYTNADVMVFTIPADYTLDPALGGWVGDGGRVVIPTNFCVGRTCTMPRR